LAQFAQHVKHILFGGMTVFQEPATDDRTGSSDAAKAVDIDRAISLDRRIDRIEDAGHSLMGCDVSILDRKPKAFDWIVGSARQFA
jgi:hypothetical protein